MDFAAATIQISMLRLDDDEDERTLSNSEVHFFQEIKETWTGPVGKFTWFGKGSLLPGSCLTPHLLQV